MRIYDLINAHEVESFLMGSRRYIVAASLRAYIARRSSEPLQSGRLPPRRDGPRGEGARASEPLRRGRGPNTPER